MKLIIVESPTKARTLSRFLGSDYEVLPTVGHIKDLPKSKLGIDVDHDFKPDYEDVTKKQETVQKIISAAKKSKEVYLATDPDREGEAISQHVAEVIGENLKGNKLKLKRIVFHEITKNAVEEAIEHPREVDKNLVDAQIARRVLDRLVGYKLSPLLWKKVRRGLSAGRVQSVAVRLIVEREREIEAFKPIEYWELYASLRSKTEKSKQFIAQLSKIEGKTAEVHDKETADKILVDLEKAGYAVKDVKKREVKKHPYPPFTTSTMTQAANRILGWSSKRTMQTAQSLYEQGLITYHRTDSTNIAEVAISKTREFIEKQYGKEYLPEKPRFYKTNSKVAQEAHEAIRPTEISNSVFKSQNEKYGREEEKLYELIWKRFVSCQMKESVYDETTILVNTKPEDYELRASGRIMKFDGFRKVLGGKMDEDNVAELPAVNKDDALDLLKLDPQQKFTEPPARYNEASLIKTLEKLGIGRPSTYAPIISTIQIRNYVEKKEKKFYPTNIGLAVNDFLTKNFDNIVDYSFTAGMEDNLDKIANGELDWVPSMKVFWKPFTEKLTYVEKHAERVKIETEKLGRECPECKTAHEAGDESRTGELVIRTGRFGKFISCSLFPDCKYTEKYMDKIDMKCPECGQGEVIIKKTKKGRSFFGCSRYPECKWASWNKPKN